MFTRSVTKQAWEIAYIANGWSYSRAQRAFVQTVSRTVVQAVRLLGIGLVRSDSQSHGCSGSKSDGCSGSREVVQTIRLLGIGLVHSDSQLGGCSGSRAVVAAVQRAVGRAHVYAVSHTVVQAVGRLFRQSDDPVCMRLGSQWVDRSGSPAVVQTVVRVVNQPFGRSFR